MRLVVFGDDFLVGGKESQLGWLQREMSKKLQIQVKIIGPDLHQDKGLVMLNRRAQVRVSLGKLTHDTPKSR